MWVVGPDGPKPLAPRINASLWSYSWGRRGISARELAWALLHDATQDERLADDWCGDLGAEIVARLPLDAFTIDASDLELWLEATTSCSAGRVALA